MNQKEILKELAEVKIRLNNIESGLLVEQVEEHRKPIEITHFLNSLSCELEEWNVLSNNGDSAYHLLKNKHSSLDQIIVTSQGNVRVYLGNWNSGFDELGRDWNK